MSLCIATALAAPHFYAQTVQAQQSYLPMQSGGPQSRAAENRFDDSLIDAANEGNLTAVQSLLRSGKYVDTQGRFGATPLMRAAFKNHTEIVNTLLGAGANPDLKDTGGATALHLAARKGHSSVAEQLLNAGANPNIQDKEGWTPLMRSALHNHPQIASALLQSGANPNLANEMGESALQHAVFAGSDAIARSLIANGANVSHQDAHGITAADIAYQRGYPQIQAMLAQPERIIAKTQPFTPQAMQPAPIQRNVYEPTPAPIAMPAPQPVQRPQHSDYASSPFAEPAPRTAYATPSPTPPSRPVAPMPKPQPVSHGSAEPAPTSLETGLFEAPPARPAPMRAPSQPQPQQYADATPMPMAAEPSYTPEPAPEPAIPARAMNDDGIDYLLQLGTFDTPRMAEGYWNQVRSQHPDLLGNLSLSIDEVRLTSESRTVYRTQAGPLSNRSMADGLCDSLGSRGTDCFVVETVSDDMATDTMMAERPPLSPHRQPVPQTASPQQAAQSTSSEEMVTLDNWSAAPDAPGALPQDAVMPPPSSNEMEWAAADSMPATQAAPEPQNTGLDDAPSFSVRRSLGMEAPTSPPVERTEPTPPPQMEPDNEYPVLEPLPEPDRMAPPMHAPVTMPEPIPSTPQWEEIPAESGAVPSTTMAPMEPTYAPPVYQAPNERRINLDEPSPIQQQPAPQPTQELATLPENSTFSNDVPPNSAEPILIMRPNTAAPEPLSASFDDPDVLEDELFADDTVDMEVAEAIRVPLSEEGEEELPLSARVTLPSEQTGRRSEWLTLGSFESREVAEDFWKEISQNNPELSSGLRFRTTVPFRKRKRATDITARIGPMKSEEQRKALCDYAQGVGYECSLVRESGQSTVANAPRLRVNPDGSKRIYARRNDPEKRPMGTTRSQRFWVQLGSYQSKPEAETVWKMMVESHPDLLGYYTPNIKEPRLTSAAYQVQRLRVGPFVDRSQASLLCAALQQRGARCLTLRDF